MYSAYILYTGNQWLFTTYYLNRMHLEFCPGLWGVFLQRHSLLEHIRTNNDNLVALPFLHHVSNLFEFATPAKLGALRSSSACSFFDTKRRDVLKQITILRFFVGVHCDTAPVHTLLTYCASSNFEVSSLPLCPIGRNFYVDVSECV